MVYAIIRAIIRLVKQLIFVIKNDLKTDKGLKVLEFV